MTREDWEHVERVLHKPDVRVAMRGRCEEQGREWEGCCSVMFHIYQQCKWCGERK